MFLFSYFIMRGIQISTSPCKQIKCYSANQKLDLHKIISNDSDIQEMHDILKGLKNKYSRNKKLAILLVEYILSKCGTNTEELLHFFREHKKRDDLADSFLMTLHFLEVDNLKKMKVNENIKTLLKGEKAKKGVGKRGGKNSSDKDEELATI